MSPTKPAEWLGRLVGSRQAEAPASAPRRRHPAPTLEEPTLRAAWQAVSLLLSYPDDRLVGLLPALREASAGLPHPVAAPLLRLVGG